jgi:hypothetical protein
VSQKEVCFRHLRYPERAVDTETGMGLLGRCGVYRGVLPVATPEEADSSSGSGVQRVISTLADIRPGMDRCSPLTEDYASGGDRVP